MKKKSHERKGVYEEKEVSRCGNHVRRQVQNVFDSNVNRIENAMCFFNLKTVFPLKLISVRWTQINALTSDRIMGLIFFSQRKLNCATMQIHSDRRGILCVHIRIVINKHAETQNNMDVRMLFRNPCASMLQMRSRKVGKYLKFSRLKRRFWQSYNKEKRELRSWIADGKWNIGEKKYRRMKSNICLELDTLTGNIVSIDSAQRVANKSNMKLSYTIAMSCVFVFPMCGSRSQTAHRAAHYSISIISIGFKLIKLHILSNYYICYLPFNSRLLFVFSFFYFFFRFILFLCLSSLKRLYLYHSQHCCRCFCYNCDGNSSCHHHHHHRHQQES